MSSCTLWMQSTDCWIVDLPWALSPNIWTADSSQSVMIVLLLKPECRCCCSLAWAAGENKIKKRPIQIRMVSVYDSAGLRASRASSTCEMMTTEDLCETPSLRSLFTALPVSQKLYCRDAIGWRSVTWRMLPASSVNMPGQESRAVLEELNLLCRLTWTVKMITSSYRWLF